MIKGEWIDKRPAIWVECSNCRGQGFAHYEHCPWCGSENATKRPELDKCNYCRGIDKSTKRSPRRKYKYCPMCGRLRDEI